MDYIDNGNANYDEEVFAILSRTETTPMPIEYDWNNERDDAITTTADAITDGIKLSFNKTSFFSLGDYCIVR